MDEINIITNNHRREVVAAHDLMPDERADFDYLTLDEMSQDRFVQYKGEWYDLGDTEGPAMGWDARVSETFFSGVLFRWPDPQEPEVIVGRYYV